MKTKSFIIPQGIIKDVNNKDNYIPNEIIYTIIAFKDSIDIDNIDTESFPKLDIDFPNGFPDGVKLIQVENLIHELNFETDDYEVNLHYRLTFDQDIIPEVQLQEFVQDTLDIIGDPEIGSKGASVRIVEPFGYIDFYISISF